MSGRPVPHTQLLQFQSHIYVIWYQQEQATQATVICGSEALAGVWQRAEEMKINAGT